MTSTRSSTNEEPDTDEKNTNQDDTKNEGQDKLDNLLLNLRTIAEIKDFDKLRVTSNDLKIDQTWIPSITRWYYADGRDNSLTKIGEVLEETFKYIETIKNNTYDNANRDIQRILVGLTTAIKGIECLKITYKKDINVITRLNLYIEKINMKVNELNSAINILPVVT
jgi:hypothetical protein